MRPREKAPRMLEIEDPITFPSAREGLCWSRAAITTASWGLSGLGFKRKGR